MDDDRRKACHFDPPWRREISQRYTAAVVQRFCWQSIQQVYLGTFTITSVLIHPLSIAFATLTIWQLLTTIAPGLQKPVIQIDKAIRCKKYSKKLVNN